MPRVRKLTREEYDEPIYFRRGRSSSSTDYRLACRELADPLTSADRKYWLCQATGRSYQELVALAASVAGRWREFETVVGYSCVNNRGRYSDNGHWRMILAWLRMYIPQWETAFVTTMQDLATLPDPEAVLAAASTALGIAPELLLHLAQHRDEIEMFLETQRSLLGTLAESKLWSLVAQGDAATIRWLLPRIKTEAYGDKLTEVHGDTPRTIKIIEVGEG